MNRIYSHSMLISHRISGVMATIPCLLGNKYLPYLIRSGNAGITPLNIPIRWLTYLSDYQGNINIDSCYRIMCNMLHVMCSKLLGVIGSYITIYALTAKAITPKAIGRSGGEAGLYNIQSNN